jgi:GTPase SAR1 family protein
MNRRKVTVDGTSACGKTRLITGLSEYATAHYHGQIKPQEYFTGEPSPITSIDLQTPESRSIDFWELSYSSYGRLTPLAYPKTSLVLLCFALDYVDENQWDVEEKVDWLISKKSPKGRDVPLILVGCRNDLRKQKEEAKSARVLTKGSEQLRQYAKKNRLAGYFECSAETKENIAELLQAVVGILFLGNTGDSARKHRKIRSSKCIVL